MRANTACSAFVSPAFFFTPARTKTRRRDAGVTKTNGFSRTYRGHRRGRERQRSPPGIHFSGNSAGRAPATKIRDQLIAGYERAITR
jgi:hypothetical protein